MLTYTAPVSDYRFLFEEVLRLDASLVGLYQDLELDSELLHSILEEAGKFSRDVLQPLNAIGDTQGCRLADGVVTTAEGFADAYRAFVAAGWSSVSSPTRTAVRACRVYCLLRPEISVDSAAYRINCVAWDGRARCSAPSHRKES